MQRDRLKFSDVYNEFHEKIRRYLERMVGRNDAEDLTQEVFLKVSNGLGEFEGRARLSTWIYRIATNVALDRLRSRLCREDSKKVEIDMTDDGLGAKKGCMEEASLSAEREAIRNEMNDCIREFVDRLPEAYRTIIILSEMKDLKNQQIGDILGISLDTVKIRLHRARARLREEFEAGCIFYEDENDGLACDRKSEKSEEGQK